MKKSLVLTAVMVALCGACTNDTEMCEVTPWEAPEWETNARAALALRAQLDVLVADTMRAAEEGTVTVDGVEVMTGPYMAGDPSIASITTPFYDGVTNNAFEEFAQLSATGTADLWDDEGNWAPGDDGGIFGSSFRGINEGGLEVRQLVDKGLFAGGALYSYAVTLTEGEISPATVEAIAALWGTNAALDSGELTDSATYSFRMGYAAAMHEALTAARAYASNEACGAERDAAIVEVFRTWEESMFARFVYYANAGASQVGAATSDDDVAGALHALSEGIGLAAGFRGVTNPASGPLSGAARVVSDAQIDAMMDALGVNLQDLGASTTGEFVSDPATFDAAVLDVESTVAGALQLDQAAVEAWRAPTEG